MNEFDLFRNDKKPSKIATGGSPKSKAKPKPKAIKAEKKEVDEDKKRFPPIIAEARRLAGSTKGLDIDAFFKKYNISYDIETLLNAPLDEDGNIK